MKSAVTIALVPQIKSGPWVFWENIEDSFTKAASLGFDAVISKTVSLDNAGEALNDWAENWGNITKIMVDFTV